MPRGRRRHEDGRKASPSALGAVLDAGPLPGLIVFDLDYTLWQAYADCTSGPPYRLFSADVAQDRHGAPIALYPGARAILGALHSRACRLAVASRSETAGWAHTLVDLMLGKELFRGGVEIFPSSKVEHFRRLRRATGVGFDSMVFLDDEERNVREVGRLGVVCERVDNGVTVEAIGSALTRYRARLNGGGSQEAS